MTVHTPVYVQPVAGDPSFPNGIPFTGQELRRLTQALLSCLPGQSLSPSGIAALDQQFVVTQRGAGANFSVDVAAGYAFVNGSDVANQGIYGCWNDSTVNVATPVAPASGTEVHRLVLEIQDKFENGTWTGYTANLNLLADTGSGTPSQPASSITLALISISAGQASVLNTNIADMRLPLFSPGLLTTTATQLVNSTSAAVVTGLSCQVGAQRYNVTGKVIWIQGSAAVEQALRLTGPAISGLMMTLREVKESTTGESVFANHVTALNTDLFGSSSGDTGTNVWDLDGWVTFTAPGTFAINARCPVSGSDTYTIQAGSFVRVTLA